MSLPHFSEESDSLYFLRKQHHKRVEAGYLSTLTHKVTPRLTAPVKIARISRLCEMGQHGLHLDAMMGTCRIRKPSKNPEPQYLPASGRKWRSRAWPDPQE